MTKYQFGMMQSYFMIILTNQFIAFHNYVAVGVFTVFATVFLTLAIYSLVKDGE